MSRCAPPYRDGTKVYICKECGHEEFVQPGRIEFCVACGSSCGDWIYMLALAPSGETEG